MLAINGFGRCRDSRNFTFRPKIEADSERPFPDRPRKELTCNIKGRTLDISDTFMVECLGGRGWGCTFGPDMSIWGSSLLAVFKT